MLYRPDRLRLKTTALAKIRQSEITIPLIMLFAHAAYTVRWISLSIEAATFRVLAAAV